MEPWMSPNSRIAIAVPVLLAAAGIHSDAQAQRSSANEFTWSERMNAGATLYVRTYKGRISVTRAEGTTAEVRGVKRPSRWERRGEEVEFFVRKSGNSVIVCAGPEDIECDIDGMSHRGHRGRDGSSDDADFTVRLPRGVALVVSSGNGDVQVNEAGADVRASSGNGDVSVTTVAGSVKASSGNGVVIVRGVEGPVSASTGNGRVYVTTSTGPVSASSGNGDIEVTMASVGIRDAMTFSTGNGSITLTMPENFKAEIDANQPGGSIYSDFPITVNSGRIGQGRVRGTIGGGGPVVRLRTGNGQIELRKR
jgi:hypothetical protein